MPTYLYICKNCHYELEELQSMSEPPLVTCPKCGHNTLARTVGAGSGLIFKGSGFYSTDYVKKSEKQSSPEKPAEQKSDDSSPTSKSESKPKTESKPAASEPKDKKD
ncbi:MAG: zinc ribbon domain-containing protein [Ignavibacteriae bacterium]|nr:zinc ribbon domain-containing protein [Ignavibacteriota bacterium]